MKTDVLRCKECKNRFTVFIKKKLSFMRQIDGLPNCKHHGEVTNAKSSS